MTIQYRAEQVAKLVEYSICGRSPRIQRETGLKITTLRAVASGRRAPSPAILSFFELEKKGDTYVWSTH